MKAGTLTPDERKALAAKLLDPTPDDYKAAIEATGMSGADVARSLNVSYVTVWRWIKGETAPAPQHRKALAGLVTNADEEKELKNG